MQPRGATGGPPRRGHGQRCSLHTEVFPSRGCGRLDTPPRPETGVCLLKGEGCPTSLPIPAEGSPPDQCPALRPQPTRLIRPRPGLGGASGEVGSGLRAWEGFVRGSGPRSGRSPQASTAAAPRLPQPQSPRWLPRTQPQTLASLGRRRRQRCGDLSCSRLLLPAWGAIPAPDPPLGSWQLPVPAAPAAWVVLLPTPTDQLPPPPPPPGQ